MRRFGLLATLATRRTTQTLDSVRPELIFVCSFSFVERPVYFEV